jgi:hypothetical protein
MPLSNVSALGKPVIAHWLDNLAARNVKEVLVLATDRPEETRAVVGDGRRWGLRVQVIPEIRELSPAEARRKYRRDDDPGKWLDAPDDSTLMDHLPGLDDFPLFDSYASWLAGVQQEIPRATTPDRIGLHEVQPGIWVGLHARIASDAQLNAPCWIGEDVDIRHGAIIGPMAVLEDRCFVERGAEISNSVIGPDTFVGEFAEVHDSIALGKTLIHTKLNSITRVDADFLLCSLVESPPTLASVGIFSRAAAVLVMALSFPLAAIPMISASRRGLPTMRSLLAVCPSAPGGTVSYRELTGAPAWLRRWPQLWSIVRGDFAWVGNRPLHPKQAARLTNDFERLWLKRRSGLVSLADVETRREKFSDEARAHSSYYAVRANRRLDCRIMARATWLLGFSFFNLLIREPFRVLTITTANEQSQEAI